MKVTFNKADVLKLIAHAKAAPKHRKTYGQKKEQPGLMLVGDQGIYLISSGEPHMPHPTKKDSSFVVYADQCNPDKMEFDDWYGAKRDIFGGDDGVILLPLQGIENALTEKGRSSPKSKTFNVWITPSQVSM